MIEKEQRTGNLDKRLFAVAIFLIWSLTTIILTITIIGIVVLLVIGDDDDGWFYIPRKCIDTIGT